MTIIMSALLRVSAVSYLNTAPFVYGLQQTPIASSIKLSLDFPAECSRKLLADDVDIGLVPVATLLDMPHYNIVSDYCLGTLGKVRTVSLLSNSPLENIETIFLDFQSRTSNLLVKILAKDLWNKEFQWVSTETTPSIANIQLKQGIIAIGDKVFEFENSFVYNYDLATEWKKFTSLPFVFAVWAANKQVPNGFSETFGSALKFGVENIPLAIQSYSNTKLNPEEAYNYLTNNISYSLDQQKRKALELFLKFGSSLAPG